jgi:hypothetical protein
MTIVLTQDATDLVLATTYKESNALTIRRKGLASKIEDLEKAMVVLGGQSF